MKGQNVGIAGVGTYIPRQCMTAQEISDATGNAWTAQAVAEKLGIVQKPIAGAGEGTQEMGYLAAKACMENANADPAEIDVILCMGEEYKEYPLTTSALYIQDRIGAVNAWGIDVQNRCCTTVSAIKMAKDMLMADDEINTILISGGYRNGDFIDYTDSKVSFMFNLGDGGGAILLKKNFGRNLVLGTHIIADASLSRTAGVEIGGQMNPITAQNIHEARKSLRLMDAEYMKNRLNEVSMPNWYTCIDRAFEKSGLTRKDMDYLAILHIKRSGHMAMLDALGLTPEQSIYLENFGHLGQIDQILSLELALKAGKVENGSVVCMLSAGIGYVWAANVIKWGG
ncbi:MAG: 3-oxoacyl-ACP synthase [Defluviitaleaceae bacterium]|nr:3-oxoacyl-ACP synthase [Defluviitaleaceae bacterium]MCL2239591.1 3-oxoacyl-ACP synthase [Defluviitaleaceae bacterium]